jgi:hypothetical protein
MLVASVLELEPQGAETFGWSKSHNKVTAPALGNTDPFP